MLTLEQLDLEIQIHANLLKHLKKSRRAMVKEQALQAETARLKEQIR